MELAVGLEDAFMNIFGLFLSYRLVADTPDGDDFYVGMKMRKDMISCVLDT